MAGIRGVRSANPKAGGKPTGIFSTRGSQKQDGASGPEMPLLSAAHASKRKMPMSSAPDGVQSKRHQTPPKIRAKAGSYARSM